MSDLRERDEIARAVFAGLAPSEQSLVVEPKAGLDRDRAARRVNRGMRATMPSGRARARSAAGAREFHGKSGSDSAMGAQWACGGSADTTGWSPAITPTLAAPPGEPTSWKNSTLAV